MIDLITAALPNASPGAKAAVLFFSVIAWSAVAPAVGAAVARALGRRVG